MSQLGSIVGEKESGLVTSLRHMGLLQSSYWASWIAFDLLMALATALSIIMWGELPAAFDHYHKYKFRDALQYSNTFGAEA
jgi:hypothetical protein